MREPSFGTEGLHGAVLSSNSQGVTNPGSRALCGHKGAARAGRSWEFLHFVWALGPTWGRSGPGMTGMLFQTQPPDGARARQLCWLNWYLGNLESSPNTFFPPPIAFKIQVPKVRENRLDLRLLPDAPPLPPRRQLRGGWGCCLLPGLGTLTQ